jgi:hypothetical protein
VVVSGRVRIRTSWPRWWQASACPGGVVRACAGSVCAVRRKLPITLAELDAMLAERVAADEECPLRKATADRIEARIWQAAVAWQAEAAGPEDQALGAPVPPD